MYAKIFGMADGCIEIEVMYIVYKNLGALAGEGAVDGYFDKFNRSSFLPTFPG